MTELQELLKQAEKSAKKAKGNLNDQEKAISSLPDGIEKNILRKAVEKAKAGDIEGVQTLIQGLQK